MANEDVKRYAKENNVPLWAVGEKMGFVYDSAFARKLRHELSEDDKSRFRTIVDGLSGKVEIKRGGNSLISTDIRIENELLKNAYGRIVKRIEKEVKENIYFCDGTGRPPVDEDYFMGLERAVMIIREEITSTGSVLEYKCEDGD